MLPPRVSCSQLQPGGTVELWKDLALATVSEAGHSAPYYKPVKVVQLVRAFVNGRIGAVP